MFTCQHNQHLPAIAIATTKHRRGIIIAPCTRNRLRKGTKSSKAKLWDSACCCSAVLLMCKITEQSNRELSGSEVFFPQGFKAAACQIHLTAAVAVAFLCVPMPEPYLRRTCMRAHPRLDRNHAKLIHVPSSSANIR